MATSHSKSFEKQSATYNGNQRHCIDYFSFPLAQIKEERRGWLQDGILPARYLCAMANFGVGAGVLVSARCREIYCTAASPRYPYQWFKSSQRATGVRNNKMSEWIK
ncbi:hypothetical protein B9Z19DRAFT_1062863 [Tuber borchii]|uniref:Uncharacterized protein n=1 Tax=Tuber borchii TaxID=42251 RepID=A0A2T7A0E5_TUBBO|nr:hypothetical protein B9Z19DRAFT_1062863 [Tuber borchii]